MHVTTTSSTLKVQHKVEGYSTASNLYAHKPDVSLDNGGKIIGSTI